MELCAWWFLADRAKKPVLVRSRCCAVASYPVTGVRQPRDKHSKTPCPVRQPRDACRKTPNPIRWPEDCAQENIKSHQQASPSEAGPGVLWICSLGWFLHRGCCRSPRRAVAGASRSELSLQLLPCWVHPEWLLSRPRYIHKSPKSSCLQGSAKCIPLV